MYCPKCRTELPDESRYCFKCGYDISQLDSLRDETPHSENESLGSGPTVRSGIDTSLEDGETLLEDSSSIKDATRYEILSTLGHGGMGEVYKARDTRLQRIVALKRLLVDLSGSQRAIDRFFNEAKSIATLNHPNIVQIYDYGEDDEGQYIAMEYVEGVNLKDHLKEKGKLKAEEATKIILHISKGLALAHERGVIHRDIKPANILLAGKPMQDPGCLMPDETQVKLTDFGLARVSGGDEMTRTGIMMGTPDYCSPEQLKDAKNVDHRTDIYSLGATFYEMVTGESPKYFREDHIPPGLRPVIRRAMSSDLAKRFQSVSEFIDSFESGTETEESTALKVACPGCGSANPMDVKYCVKCGHDLTHLFEKCPKCERENRVDVEFCGGCGYSLYNYRKIQKFRENGLKLRAESQYDEALGIWNRILELEKDNKETIEEKKKEEDTLRKIDETADRLRKAHAVENYERVRSLYDELVALQPAYRKEFEGLSQKAFKGIARQKAEDDSVRFRQGKVEASTAVDSWQAYMELADTEDEQDAAHQAIEELNRDEERILGLLSQLKTEYQQKRYDQCDETIVEIGKILSDNSRYREIQESIGKAREKVVSLLQEVDRCLKEKDYEKALEKMEQGLSIDPYHKRLLAGKEEVEYRLKRLSDELERLEGEQGRSGGLEKLLDNIRELGREYPKSQKLNTQKTRIEKRLAEISKFIEGGNNALENKWTRDAKDAFEKALQIEPESKQAQEGLRKAEENLRQIEELQRKIEETKEKKAYKESVLFLKELKMIGYEKGIDDEIERLGRLVRKRRRFLAAAMTVFLIMTAFVYFTIEERIQEKRFWTEVSQLDDLEGYRKYLSRFSDGMHAKMVRKKIFEITNEKRKMIHVFGGCFEMGCGSWTSDCEPDEEPVHEVCVDNFYMDRYEVTQADFESVMGSNPSSFDGSNNPVENVTWHEANEYCGMVGKRLPTEAEWEYAARSGGKREKYAGTSSYSSLGDYAWYGDNSSSKTHPVGQKKPNGLELHDMSGNVREWCSDWYFDYKISSKRNPKGLGLGLARVLRGGSWDSKPRIVRASDRYYGVPIGRRESSGFRCSRTQ